MSKYTRGASLQVRFLHLHSMILRPLSKKEYNEGDINIVEACVDQKITLRDKTSARSYTFDRVFGPHSRQNDIYNEMVAPTVMEVIEGYNCTIFA